MIVIFFSLKSMFFRFYKIIVVNIFVNNKWKLVFPENPSIGTISLIWNGLIRLSGWTRIRHVLSALDTTRGYISTCKTLFTTSFSFPLPSRALRWFVFIRFISHMIPVSILLMSLIKGVPIGKHTEHVTIQALWFCKINCDLPQCLCENFLIIISPDNFNVRW